MISEDTSTLINEQVGHEFSASLQYTAISTWFDSESLPNLAGYFATQADEERVHALKMIKYLGDRGQTVTIPAIPQPKSIFASVEEAIQLSYDQEVEVTEQIEAIYNSAADNNDRLTQSFLQWFLDEQVEEVSSMDTLLTLTRRAGSDLFRLEDFVAREGHPEDGANP